jgi:mRNA-degrading endonuclease RelE of RelBE toxin-antitoxin system
MKLEFHDLAKAEVSKSMLYYESEQSNLGDEFLDEIEKAIDLIKLYPLAWPSVGLQVRAIQTKRFEYRIFYRIYEDVVYIVAVSHCAQKPLYWIDRLNS